MKTQPTVKQTHAGKVDLTIAHHAVLLGESRPIEVITNRRDGRRLGRNPLDCYRYYRLSFLNVTSDRLRESGDANEGHISSLPRRSCARRVIWRPLAARPAGGAQAHRVDCYDRITTRKTIEDLHLIPGAAH